MIGALSAVGQQAATWCKGFSSAGLPWRKIFFPFQGSPQQATQGSG